MQIFVICVVLLASRRKTCDDEIYSVFLVSVSALNIVSYTSGKLPLIIALAYNEIHIPIT